MKKITKVFWIVFAVYSALTFIGALIVEQNENNLGFLINMKGYIPLLKYYTFFGLVLFVLAFISRWRSKLGSSKRISSLEEEKKELKANLFDIQKQKESPAVSGETDSPPEQE